jgi:hypothetical protein
MKIKACLSLAAALSVASGVAHAAPHRADLEPGLEVADRCMVEGLRESGFTGSIRVRAAQAADRSLEICDAAAEAREVEQFTAVARPCMALALRRQGYVGQIAPPRGGRLNAAERACATGEAPAWDEVSGGDIATFRRADGMEITTMRPVPNPEDMGPHERRRVYGK